jgi:hypothetical protein
MYIFNQYFNREIKIKIIINMSESEGQLQDYSVDQAAGAVVLVLGAIAGLLQVIWMSKCHCKVNLCYIFRCERRPPTEEEMKTLKNKVKEVKGVKDKDKDKIKPTTSKPNEPEPEPEPEIDNLV